MKKAEVNLVGPLDLLNKMFPGKKYEELTEEEEDQFAKEILRLLNITKK